MNGYLKSVYLGFFPFNPILIAFCMKCQITLSAVRMCICLPEDIPTFSALSILSFKSGVDKFASPPLGGI